MTFMKVAKAIVVTTSVIKCAIPPLMPKTLNNVNIVETFVVGSELRTLVLLLSTYL